MTKLIDSNIGAVPLPNAHPSIDLARATRRLLDLKKTTSKTRFNRAELIRDLGFGPKSGAANPVISALIHFGFLQREETDYVYTELADKLSAVNADSKEYHDLLGQALSSPELYKWLSSKYGEQLPDEIDDILIGKYHDRNITNGNVKGIVNNYLKSITFTKNIIKHIDDKSEPDEYVSVSFRGNTVPVYRKYLLEAIQRTRDDELTKINESLM
jgi:hypothetical protein